MVQDEPPVDLYVAAYDDPATAEQEWDAIRQLAADKVLRVEALVLLRRDLDGSIHVKDSAHDAGRGAVLGAVGGAVVGLIFPPALLAAAAVGAGLGAGTGAVVDQVQKRKIRSDVEATLPPGSSGIVAVVEERWITEVEKALVKAERTERHHAHDAR